MNSIGRKHSQGTDTHRKQTINKCSTRVDIDDFVLIDLDSETPDVTVVDVPESVQRKLKMPSPPTVIDVDDDDDDEAAGGVYGDNDDDSATSIGCSSKLLHSPNIVKAKDKNYSVVSNRNSPVNLSTPRKTYPGKPGSRNLSGVVSASESSSTASDCSDCECVDGPAGKIRELWELASRRRKNATAPGHTSASNPDHRSTGEGEIGAKNSSVSDHDKRKSKEKSFPFVDPVCAFRDSPKNDDKHSDDFAFAFSVRGASSSPNVENGRGSKHVSTENSSSKDAENPHNYSAQEHVMDTTEFDNNLSSPFVDLETMIGSEPCFFNVQPTFDEQLDCDLSEFLQKDPTVLKPHVSDDGNSECDWLGSVDANEELPELFQNYKAYQGVDIEEKSADYCQKPMSVSLHKHQKAETGYIYTSSVQMEDNVSTCDPSNGLASSNTTDVQQDLGGKPCQNDTIIDRQSIKETSEYKRAMEEEWASRQQQLQIQAEEAQRLRLLHRRKRAESMRNRDVKRRQKQRLEEVRETQRRDQANLNIKEQLRTEIRQELNLVENSCKDMASLLRRLGLVVNSGSKNEVQAAYKKALLKFHPDRASRTDIRQQVEAEEKFKVISRMKAKFSFA